MGSLSIWHWLVVIAIALLFFGGRGKISGVMGDFAEGIKAFKKGMQDDDTAEKKPDPVKSIDHSASASTAARSDVGSKAV